MKVVIGNARTGKTYSVETDVSNFTGKKVGDAVKGEILNLTGYELEITGGSDASGTPMRRDVSGATSRKLLLSKSTGFRGKRKGERRKKRIHGNIVSGNIVQLNTKVVKEGKEALDKLLAPAAEEAPSEKGADEVKVEEKPEKESPEEKKEEAPAKEKAEEVAEEKTEEDSDKKAVEG
ncbi:TPA: 30S ribosomal protein S6e [archaeon]|jgi:small subunit ribosomal protein S6e|uniref:Small ribosomal subunit protein eS6 n=1 Tax=Candidatus Undinarchaeum marinum TaxID=2756141 RepID=A0A832V0U7_9ARCH|nr:30S ribosomal protein S6e [Candidatus Undinarchaeum marinum]